MEKIVEINHKKYKYYINFYITIKNNRDYFCSCDIYPFDQILETKTESAITLSVPCSEEECNKILSNAKEREQYIYEKFKNIIESLLNNFVLYISTYKT